MNLFQRITSPFTDGYFGSPPQKRQLTELVNTMTGEKVERIGENFQSFVSRAYLDNGVVWAAVIARLVLFSQARFVLRNRNTLELTRLPRRLSFLEEPWPNGTTAELLARIEQDTSLAGNYYIFKAEPNRLQRWRPDWVDVITDGREPIGYAYFNGGDRGKKPFVARVDEVGHGNPYPDPLKAFMGNSWLASVTRDIMSDQAMNAHKLKFFEQAATPNLLIKLQQTLNPEQKQSLMAALEERHTGLKNAWKTMVLEGGADAQIIGTNFEQMAFDTIQAAGENRIAVAARVPSVVLGIKEGADQATYNNYGQAVRAFSDHTIQHLWIHAAGVLGQIVDVPAGQELWLDTRHIAALQADAMDEAKIRQTDAGTIRSLTDAGFTPESVIAAVINGDFKALKHSGLFSVQLQEAGADEPDDDTPSDEPDPPPDELTDDTDERFDSIIATFKGN